MGRNTFVHRPDVVFANSFIPETAQQEVLLLRYMNSFAYYVYLGVVPGICVTAVICSMFQSWRLLSAIVTY